MANELDQLIDCAGADCYSHPTGQLAGQRDRQRPEGLHPGAADRDRHGDRRRRTIGSVTFRVEGTALGTDTEPPYSVAVPDQPLRKVLPEAGTVTAKVLYGDGRRLGLVDTVRACA